MRIDVYNSRGVADLSCKWANTFRSGIITEGAFGDTAISKVSQKLNDGIGEKLVFMFTMSEDRCRKGISQENNGSKNFRVRDNFEPRTNMFRHVMTNRQLPKQTLVSA